MNTLISAIDNHNVANGDESWFSRRVNATGEFFSDLGEGIAYGTPSAIVAGVNSILNTGVAVANFLGSNVEPFNTYDQLRSLDSDLGQYYARHKEGVETAGFLITSLVPGMAGVKAVQAAKAGFMGTNMARASGLMETVTRDYAMVARAEFAAGNSPFTVLNADVIKSLGQGLGSAALEAAGFETMVAATMYKSPVLDGQGFGDIVNNIAVGTLLGGGIGGLLHGVSLVSGMKKGRALFNQELDPYKRISELGDNASSELKIINYYQQKLNLPEAGLLEDAGPMGKGQINKDLTPVERLKIITNEREKTVSRLDNLIQQELNTFAQKDVTLAEQLKKVLDNAKEPVDIANSLMHASNMQRITASEKLAFGDVQFPIHNIPLDKFQILRAVGDWDMLMTPSGAPQARGFIIRGNLTDLKVTNAKVEGDYPHQTFESREGAFAAGYDLYRNANGSLSVNPNSKILVSSADRRAANNIIVDFEQGGAVVDKATPTLVDYATPSSPITVRGDYVYAGEVKPIHVSTTTKYDPTQGTVLEAQARTIWANSQKPIRWEGRSVGEYDLPLLEKAYYDGDKASGWTIKTNDGKSILAPKGEHLRRFIEDQKKELAAKLNGRPLDEISARLNVSERWLRGENDEVAKIRPGVDYNIPRYARVNFQEGDALQTLQTNMVEGMAEYERQVGLIRQRHQQNFANYAGGEAQNFPDAPNISDPGRAPRGYGAGSSLFGFSNAALGSYEGWAQFIGSLTNKLKLGQKTKTAEAVSPALAAIKAAGNDAVAELSILTNKLRSSPEPFVFHPEFPDTLIPRRGLKSLAEGEGLEESLETIKIKSPEVIDFLKTHSEINGRRQTHVDNLKGSAGVGSDFDPNVVYAPPIDTERYKNFVFIKPRGITLADKTRVLAAKDEATLQRMIANVDKDQFRVITKQESEEFHKAKGDYDFSLGLNESRVDSELHRKGTLSDAMPTTSADRILDDYMDWHMKQEELLATRMVEHRYSPDFQSLERLGERYTDVATSQMRSLSDKLKESVKDPYYDIVKTALDISRASEYQWWRSFNDTVRSAIEQPINKLREAFTTAPKIDDAFVDKVNKISEDLGLGKPFADATAAMVANGNIAPKPWLARGIAKAQAALSTTLLQWDFFNAINNTVSSPIILSSEVAYLRKAIQEANPEIAGKLANLMKVVAPDGSGIELPSTARLVKQAFENYRLDAGEGKGVLLKRYQDIRVVTDVLQQERMALDNLTFDYKNLTPSQLEAGIQKYTEIAKTWTGNKLAEQMTRFISADVMRQITDIAVEAGVLKNVGEANEFIANFVNKTQGNYLSSQRPIVFQGVVGQAISLFQTYQFNLMQQLFKYVGDGDKKSLGILLGLQGSTYGMQGLPAFNFINTHIVGNASGNTQHRDLYYASNSVFGKALGDWILYGAGSNALGLIDPQMKVNLYSRGDINPRQVTVLPTSLEDIPIVNASVRFVGNLYNAGEKIAKGGALWPTVSQAVEHNGLSRPLAGLAQTIQGYTTTTQGSLLSSSQDFWMISNLSRVAGGKPFDEAVALDALYRVNAYRAKDLANIQELGSAIKTTVVGGGTPTPQQTESFAAAYAKSGGKIESFNRFLTGVMMSANQSQVNKLASNLTSNYAYQLQLSMGGRPLPDFMNQPARE